MGFHYKWHDNTGQWLRSYGNELWEFDVQGLMRRRKANLMTARSQRSSRGFDGRPPRPRPAEPREFRAYTEGLSPRRSRASKPENLPGNSSLFRTRRKSTLLRKAALAVAHVVRFRTAAESTCSIGFQKLVVSVTWEMRNVF